MQHDIRSVQYLGVDTTPAAGCSSFRSAEESACLSADVPGNGDCSVAAQPRPAAADLAPRARHAGRHPGAGGAGGGQAGGLPTRGTRCAGPAARLPAPAALQGGRLLTPG